MIHRMLCFGLLGVAGILSLGCSDKKDGGEAKIEVKDGIPKEKEVSKRNPPRFGGARAPE